jgi:basic amino acid/polyamine antiporter, APA family
MADQAPIDETVRSDTNDVREASGTLGLWDAVSLVIGIVVGTAIFRSSQLVLLNTANPWQALGAWALGGILSLVGAFCYAELATTYPRTGGDYEYLTRAFGRWAGFLFGWAQLTAVFSANLGAMAYAFGDYGVELFGLGKDAVVWFAVTAIVSMTVLNILAVGAGTWTQNLLTAAKVAGIVCVILAGLWRAGASPPPASTSSPPPANADAPSTVAPPVAEAAAPTETSGAPIHFGVAMVFVLYAYGGWSDAAFVAAEVRNRSRNLPLAIIGGVGAIMVIYLAVNAAYIRGLGFEQAQNEATPAAAVMRQAVGVGGARFASVLVMISALGAINGMILSRSRVFAMLGDDHRALAWLGGWRPGAGSPRASLIAQAGVTLALVLAVGSPRGQSAVNALLRPLGVAIPWNDYGGGFDTLVAATAPVFWALFLATGIAMMVLRQHEPDRERPFRAPLYPLTPLLFCATCVYMLWSSVAYAQWLAFAAAAPVLAGLVLYAVTRRR